MGDDDGPPADINLPPGFVAVKSASRPGQFSYLDKLTGKKYMTVQQTWEIHHERLKAEGKEQAGGAGPSGKGGTGQFNKKDGDGDKGEGKIPSQAQLKEVQQILSTPQETTDSAKQWFNKYITEGAEGLLAKELKNLIDDLNNELCLPPLSDERLLGALFTKFDTNKNNVLEFNEFLNLYAAILRRVRDRYVKAAIRRDFFIDKNKGGKPSTYYENIAKLGEGSFGLVYKVKCKASGEERVLKVINKAKSAMPPEELQLEINTLKALDHPHIIRLFEYFEDYNNIYIVMEAAKGGELLEVIESIYKDGYRLNEQWVATVVEQSLTAIAYVHARGLMHKDIKAENIMLLDVGGQDAATQPHAVIIDLGLAEMFEAGSRSNNIAGTPVTMAPEVWNRCFGPKCDIWSMGVVLFQLLSSELPFKVNSIKKAAWLAVLYKPPKWEKLKHCSEQAVKLCQSMLQVDEAQRPSARKCLEAKWFEIAPHLKDEILSKEQVMDLVKLYERNDLEKVVRMQVASQLSASKLPHLNAIFKRYDADCNGTLSADELKACLMELGVDANTCGKAAEALDMDNSGEVEYTEFISGCLNFFDDNLDNMLWQAFTKFDLDGSGQLSVKEIEQLLSKGAEYGLGTLISDPTQVKNMIEQMDKDANGEVNFDEFRQFFTPELSSGSTAKKNRPSQAKLMSMKGEKAPEKSEEKKEEEKKDSK